MEKLNELPQAFYGVIQSGKVVMLPADDGQWLNKTSVAEALRALEQNLAEVRQYNLEYAEREQQLELRAEAAEAKLADLAKQAAAGTVWINCTTRGTEYEFRQSASINIKNGQELFTRAAPAADLAELVPDAKAIRKEAGSYAPVYSLQEQQLFIDGATWLSAAILRNIEEAK